MHHDLWVLTGERAGGCCQAEFAEAISVAVVPPLLQQLLPSTPRVCNKFTRGLGHLVRGQERRQEAVSDVRNDLVDRNVAAAAGDADDATTSKESFPDERLCQRQRSQEVGLERALRHVPVADAWRRRRPRQVASDPSVVHESRQAAAFPHELPQPRQGRRARGRIRDVQAQGLHGCAAAGRQVLGDACDGRLRASGIAACGDHGDGRLWC
mmetsp:Transcript_86011/g.256579  ORF Transcript_86011/g.256579 Transcript_86011/m.256579 type:complete len:211 (+) Transcript_86011:265-897(+)